MAASSAMSHPGARKGRSAAEAADLDLCGSMGVTVVLDERLILAGLAMMTLSAVALQGRHFHALQRQIQTGELPATHPG